MELRALFILNDTSQSLRDSIQESGLASSRVSNDRNLESEMVVIIFVLLTSHHVHIGVGGHWSWLHTTTVVSVQSSSHLVRRLPVLVLLPVVSLRDEGAIVLKTLHY